MAEKQRPPEGLSSCRVLDLAAPGGQYCSKLLADLGADVIKVEPPNGDGGRRLGPFKDEDTARRHSLFFAYYNTNKRSLAVDRWREEGREIFGRLILQTDVIIETPGLTPDSAAALDYAALAALNPRLILTSFTPFGSSGPYASQRATSPTLFALSGIMKSIGPPEGPPAGAVGQMALDLAAVDAAIGTLCALIARQQTGRGQHVEVAAFEVLAAQLGSPLAPRGVADRTGHSHPQLAPSGTYQCRDGAVELTIIMPGQWQRLKDLLGDVPELKRPEWDDRSYRMANAEQLYAIVSEAIRDRTMAELTRQAQGMQIPCLPVNAVSDVMANPQITARGFFRETESADLGRHTMPGAPYRLSEPRWALRRPAPRLGEHTASILRDELAYASAEIANLQAAGVVAVDD